MLRGGWRAARCAAGLQRPARASAVSSTAVRKLPHHLVSSGFVPLSRALFDGRPRGEGYQHFKSAKGHSDSGARVWYVVIASVPSSLLLYYAAHLDRAPYTRRVRMIDLSREKELAMGLSQYRRLIASHPVLPAQHPASQLVKRVGARIAAVADLDVEWEFQVLDSPTVSD
jgi:hypothetical protein